MAQVNYAAGDISFAVRESATGTAQFQVQTRIENVSGVQLPIFESHIQSSSSSSSSSGNGNGNGGGGGDNFNNNGNNSTGNGELTALSRGGQQVQKCRDANQRFLQSLLNLASLQTTFHILEEVIQVTNRRVNALEYVILPKTENTISYIISELDEQDREEFFRLKKVQAKKKNKESENEKAKIKEEDGEEGEEGEDDYCGDYGEFYYSKKGDSDYNYDQDQDQNYDQDYNYNSQESNQFNLLDLENDPDIIFWKNKNMDILFFVEIKISVFIFSLVY